jgi:hypothetical protein
MLPTGLSHIAAPGIYPFFIGDIGGWKGRQNLNSWRALQCGGDWIRTGIAQR